jgi:hypothetical protein
MERIILDTQRIDESDEYRQALRHRCETDHFFLAQLMGFYDFVERIHRPVADLYFPKNRNLSIQDQHPIKFRLHLDPRLTFKTSFGRVDTLQWILAFPESITILNQSATQPLAEAISVKVADYFHKPEWKKPTILQKLYPELCVSKKPEGKWNTPNHDSVDLDATLDYTSPLTTQSGWHPLVDQPDDMADTKNSGIRAKAEVRQGVIDTFNTNKYTLRPGGYRNIRGTRYHPLDLYGDLIAKMDPDEWKMLIRSALTVKDGSRLTPGTFPKEDELEFHFHELPNLQYKALRTNFYDHYEAFMSQMMNDPQGGIVATFDEKLYSTCLIDDERIPILGDNVMAWRLPYQGKNYMAQYAEGAAARIVDGKVYVTDAWKGIYTPTNLAIKLIVEAKRLDVRSIIMEDLPGVHYMAQHIQNESYRRNYRIRIHWLDYEEQDASRFSRFRLLEPVMRSGRLMISRATSKATELRNQFLSFGLVLENGILDCVSRCVDRVPWSILRSSLEDEELELQQRRQEEAAFNAIFRQQGMQVVDDEQRQRAEAHVLAMDRTSYGFAPLPGGLEG